MPARREASAGRRTAAGLALACLLGLAGAAGDRAVGPESLRDLLPADGAVPGWSRDGEVQEFAGDDLYAYIDGGAEIYEEYGFRRVAVQDYRTAAGASVSLELFEMATPEAAYGIYTFKRSGKGKGVALGGGGDLEDYYLNFWKGRYLATLTGFDQAPETLAGLRALAGAVDAKIAGTAGLPDLPAALPSQGLKPGSVKFLKGPLGLNNVYPFYTAAGLGFRSAVAAEYEDGTSAIILDYGREDARAGAWDELRAALEASKRFAPAPAEADGTPVFRDPKGRYSAFAPSGPRLLVGIGPTAAAARNRIR